MGRDFRRRAGRDLGPGFVLRTRTCPPPRCCPCCAECPARWAPPSPGSAPRPPRRLGRCCSPRPGRACGPSGCSVCAPAFCAPAGPAAAAAASCTPRVRPGAGAQSRGTGGRGVEPGDGVQGLGVKGRQWGAPSHRPQPPPLVDEPGLHPRGTAFPVFTQQVWRFGAALLPLPGGRLRPEARKGSFGEAVVGVEGGRSKGG